MGINNEFKFIINEGDKRISCIRQDSNFPSDTTVIFLHGLAADKNESNLFVDLSNLLAERGFHTLRFDFSGCGESRGDFQKIDINDYQADFRLVLQYLRNKYPYQSRN